MKNKIFRTVARDLLDLKIERNDKTSIYVQMKKSKKTYSNTRKTTTFIYKSEKGDHATINNYCGNEIKKESDLLNRKKTNCTKTRKSKSNGQKSQNDFLASKNYPGK